MNLTIAYSTSRRNPRIEWFLDALDVQDPDCSVKVIVVDFWAKERSLPFPRPERILKHVPFKPNVWNGPHRLTQVDWWGASNTRNTALLLCPDGWICYADDLSAPCADWLTRVKEAMKFNGVTCGGYRKVNNLVVEKGQVKFFTPFSEDHRLARAGSSIIDCDGGWHFGCSVVGRVDDYLKVGGWPEMADGLGFEDVLMGCSLQNVGVRFRYDPKMLTYESEELHYEEGGKSFRKSDYGVSPSDKSHAAVNWARKEKNWANWFPDGIATYRQRCLHGEPFVIPTEPTHEWFTGTPLKDLA
jgi:hypothetical protein